MNKTYLNFACNMLCPLNANATDDYLKRNLEEIRQSAQQILRHMHYTPTTIYRGVILHDRITALEPHPNFTYLSFSEDKNIAYNFADLSPDGFPCIHDLGQYGYIAEYTPRPEEILFHYRFFDLLPIIQLLNRAGMGADDMPLQREVTILQPSKPITNVTPFKKYEGYKPYKLV